MAVYFSCFLYCIKIFFCYPLQEISCNTQWLVNTGYNQFTDQLRMFFSKFRQALFICLFTYEVSYIQGKKITALQKKIDIAKSNMVCINKILPFPSTLIHRLISFYPHILRSGFDDSVFTVGFIPDNG